MEKTSFESLAERTLEDLAEIIESSDEGGLLEVEYSSGVLTITLPGGKQYVLNRHRVTEKLWWSSPISGAKYFTLTTENQWLDKEQQELKKLLFAELKILSGIKVV